MITGTWRLGTSGDMATCNTANHSNICVTSHPQSERGHSNGNLSSGLWPQGADHGDSYCGPTCTNRNKLSSRTS